MLWQSRGMVGAIRYHVPSEETLICDELLAGAVTGPVSLWQDRHGSPYFSLPAPIVGGWSESGCGVRTAHWLLMLVHVAGLSIWMRWRMRREQDFAVPAKEVVGGVVPQCPGDRSSTTPLA